jgi:hypothetical protein
MFARKAGKVCQGQTLQLICPFVSYEEKSLDNSVSEVDIVKPFAVIVHAVLW